MKRNLLTFSLGLLACTAVRAQITITAADMPVNGDKLRYSISLPTVALNLSNTGANIAWDYSTLVPQTQVVDSYKTAAAAGYSGGGIPATAFGYKVADSLPGAPIPVNDVYTFFSLKPLTASTRFRLRAGTDQFGDPRTPATWSRRSSPASDVGHCLGGRTSRRSVANRHRLPLLWERRR